MLCDTAHRQHKKSEKHCPETCDYDSYSVACFSTILRIQSIMYGPPDYLTAQNALAENKQNTYKWLGVVSLLNFILR
jgi:hypothetical protein